MFDHVTWRVLLVLYPPPDNVIIQDFGFSRDSILWFLLVEFFVVLFKPLQSCEEFSVVYFRIHKRIVEVKLG